MRQKKNGLENLVLITQLGLNIVTPVLICVLFGSWIDKKTGLPKVDKEGHYKAKTSHTLNPVPCIIYDNFGADNYTVKTEGSYGLSNIAATLVNLMGYKAPDFWDESMIELKK